MAVPTAGTLELDVTSTEADTGARRTPVRRVHQLIGRPPMQPLIASSEHPQFLARLMRDEEHAGSCKVADDDERDTKRTTIVTSDREGRGGAVLVVAVMVILVLLLLLFFGGGFKRDEQPQLNVDVNTPDVNVIMPQTQVPVMPVPQTQTPPSVNVNVTTPPPEPPAENLSNTEIGVTNRG